VVWGDGGFFKFGFRYEDGEYFNKDGLLGGGECLDQFKGSFQPLPTHSAMLYPLWRGVEVNI
jgi:hypothetical protein